MSGRAYFGLQFASAPGHSLCRHLKRLNQIRKAVSALQAGVMEHVSEWGRWNAFCPQL